MSSVNVGPEGIHPAPRQRFFEGRTRIVLSLFVVGALIASIAFTTTTLIGAHAQGNAGKPVISPAQLKVLSKELKSKIHILPKAKSHALKAVAAAPAYNNIGTSSDATPSTANFDGGGFSYSEQALSSSGISPNQTFVYDGITFTWPNMASGSANNYLAAGQVLPIAPVAGATTVGFLGSAIVGPSTGTATITYTDGTTKQFPLTMSDWTLNGGGGRPTGSVVVSAMLYRNTATTQQTVKTYIFYASVSVDSTKTVQSVTLPGAVNQGQLHIFAVGARANYSNPYNNTAMSDDANVSTGNFDGGGNSYSFTSFIGTPGNGYLAPGSTVQYNAMDFTWPDVPAGVPDNYLAHAQTIAVPSVPNAVRVGFIGAANNGPSCGMARINYSDGSTQPFSLCLSDWTLNALSTPAVSGNIPFSIDTYRNTPSGQQTVFTFAYYTDVRVQSSKTVQSVTLPSSTNQGRMHIFAVGASAEEVPNNVGASRDAAAQIFANLDGGGSGYSLDAMQKAGLPLDPNNDVNVVSFNGVSFNFVNSGSLFPDNMVPEGQNLQVFPVTNATRLAFLGTSVDGAQSIMATITYNDGSTQTFQLGFNDWCVSSPLQFGNSIVATMSYRNTLKGAQTINNSLYYTQVALQAGKNIVSITLPPNSNMHIYSMATAGA